MKTFRKWNNKAVDDCGSYMSKEAHSFAVAFRNMVKRELTPHGFAISRFIIGHYYLSMFVEKDGKYIYIYFSIPRHGQRIDFNAKDCLNGVLYRSASSCNDFHGGSNHFCSVYELSEVIKRFYKLESEWKQVA